MYCCSLFYWIDVATAILYTLNFNKQVLSELVIQTWKYPSGKNPCVVLGLALGSNNSDGNAYRISC